MRYNKISSPSNAKKNLASSNVNKPSYASVANTSKVAFTQIHSNNSQNERITHKAISQTSNSQSSNLSNNERVLLHGRLDKIDFMFQQLSEQMTKLTNRVAALEGLNNQSSNSNFGKDNMSFDFTPVNANNKRIRTDDLTEIVSLTRSPGTALSPSVNADVSPTQVFLGPSPTPTSPLIIPEDNFNDRLSSLETTASTVVAAMNNLTQRLFTSNSNRDQNTADEPKDYNDRSFAHHE